MRLAVDFSIGFLSLLLKKQLNRTMDLQNTMQYFLMSREDRGSVIHQAPKEIIFKIISLAYQWEHFTGNNHKHIRIIIL